MIKTQIEIFSDDSHEDDDVVLFSNLQQERVQVE